MLDFTQLIGAIQKSSLAAFDIVEETNLEIFETYFENESGKNNDVLKAKTVSVEYPRETKDGIVSHHVNVPLLTLVPISLPHISEIDFEIDLEIHLDGEELKVAFPKLKKSKSNSEKESTDEELYSNAKLKMKITKDTPTDGLKSIVEGYEKALRAQIPG